MQNIKKCLTIKSNYVIINIRKEIWKMYYKLEENERIMLNKIREITLANYDIERDYIKSEDIFNILKDLLVEYNVLEEKYQSVKNKIIDRS